MKKESLLLTGSSGFLGHCILPILEQNYEVTTCGLDRSDAVCVDLSVKVPDFDKSFDIVVHAAGRAHVDPKSHEQRQAFFDVNYKGTINLCRALANGKLPRALVFISTVAVYGVESGVMINEDWLLNGTTPYAVSNIQAERFLTQWCSANGVKLTILRPALMAGPKAKGSLGAMVHGIQHGYYSNIAGGRARKSMLMAADIATLIPLAVDKGGIYNVCDNHNPSYAELACVIARQCGRRKVLSIPTWIAKPLAYVGEYLLRGRLLGLDRYRKLTKTLTFSNERACSELGWTPTDVLTSYNIYR